MAMLPNKKLKIMAEIIVTTNSNDTIKCVSFFDADIDCGGIELFQNENNLGELFGYNIPDEEDENEVEKFTTVVENWLIDNGY